MVHSARRLLKQPAMEPDNGGETALLHGVADDSAFLFVTDGSIYASVMMVAEPFYQHQATKQR